MTIKVDGLYIENKINELLNEYEVPKKVLSSLLGINEEFILEYSK